MAEKRKRRRAARDVYGAVGFDLMYENGIAQVEEGLFSQTLAFDDISDQSAREETQQAIFSGWCQLFDYFGAESCACSFPSRTAPSPPTSSAASASSTPSDPRDWSSAYADEYNRDTSTTRCARACRTSARERYLTFSVGAASIADAIPKLARMQDSDA